jgi:hypothetical protein
MLSTARPPLPAGRNDETLALADRLEREASTPAENPLLATAKLLRGTTEWLAGDAAKANAFAKEARTLPRRRVRPVPQVLGSDVDRHHGEEPWAAGGIPRSTAGRAVDGRAAEQSVPPLSRSLSAFQSVPDVEAAPKRARREPRGVSVRRDRRPARRRW